jgi:hypothetical protein
MLSKFSPVAGLIDAHNRRSNGNSPSEKKTLPSLNMNPNMQKVLLKYAAQKKDPEKLEADEDEIPAERQFKLNENYINNFNAKSSKL